MTRQPNEVRAYFLFLPMRLVYYYMHELVCVNEMVNYNASIRTVICHGILGIQPQRIAAQQSENMHQLQFNAFCHAGIRNVST